MRIEPVLDPELSVPASRFRDMRRPETPLAADTSRRVLDRVRASHQAVCAWRVSELESVLEWADAHRLEPPVEAPVEAPVVPVVSHPGPRGTEGVLFLAGPGAGGVEEFALAELAAVLGVSERAARKYVGEAIERACQGFCVRGRSVFIGGVRSGRGRPGRVGRVPSSSSW